MLDTKERVFLRRQNIKLERMLRVISDTKERAKIIKTIGSNKRLVKKSYTNQNNLPTLGKLVDIIEKDLKEEANEYTTDYDKSDLDIKRLALKEAFYDYYNDQLNTNTANVPVVDYVGDDTLRRDNQKFKEMAYNFAPNKNKIYSIWMDNLERHIRSGRLNQSEFDESVERGIPQGGAFEKQLDRYRQDIMKKLWEEYSQ